jgi:prophage regulatory protein
MSRLNLHSPDSTSDRPDTPRTQGPATLYGFPLPPQPAFEPQPLVVDAKPLAVILGGIGVRTVRALDAAGKLPKPIRIGGRVVWLLDEIRAWLAAGAPPRAEWEARKRADKGGRR